MSTGFTKLFSNSLSSEWADELDEIVDRGTYDVSVETVTSGAISLDKRTTYVSVSGTKAYTLADGTWEGQQKLLICTAAGTTPVGTITPANLFGGDRVSFNALSDSVLLEWHAATGWNALDRQAVTIS